VITKGEMTRARVIEQAGTLINRKGFSNTSTNDIVEATGVKKGNLYFHFPSKENLGLSILEKAQEDFFLFLEDSLQGESPLEKIFNFFDAALEMHRRKKFVGGCIFGNTALEMGDANIRFSKKIHGVFRKWTAILTDLLVEATEMGELKTDISPEILAKHIVATIEGGIMLSKVSKKEDDLRDCLQSLRILLGS
jgi:TetR/AcrR family transcriptional repressor of nem operon